MDRIDGTVAVSEDLSEPEPFGTRSVWQGLRIQTAVEISAQVSFHTDLPTTVQGLAEIGKDIHNSPELATFFTFFLRQSFCSVPCTKAFKIKLFLLFLPPPLK